MTEPLTDLEAEALDALKLAHDHLALNHYDLDETPTPEIAQINASITKLEAKRWAHLAAKLNGGSHD